jgi:3-hydroxyisobutyrate dehydrogenase-like beta-hydroxyacid dehydrogenase
MVDGLPSRRIGVIGLGFMGTAIAERLLAAGFVPVVWNRTRDKADSLVTCGALWSDDPFAECDRVIVSLFSSDVVREVLEARLGSIRPGQTLIDTTTGDPASSEAWERRLQSLGCTYLDAPISGSSEQTRQGEATVIASGDRAAFDACRDLWPVLGRRVFHVGPCGSAAKMKLVSNLVLGLNRAALAEGLALAEVFGLDLPATLDVLQQSAAYSRQMDTKGPKMIDRDFTPQARLSQHLKDVRLILAAAEQGGLSLSLSAAHRDLLQRAESLGLGDLDNSAVVEAVRRKST